MKRTSAQVGFPVERQIRNEPMTIPLVCCNSDNIDAVKKILTYRISEITGRRPQLECFQ